MGSAPHVADGATYVACFTEKPDQLSQWRGYGGRGYALGFTKQGLAELIVEVAEDVDSPAGPIYEVGYGTPAIEHLLKEVANYFNDRRLSAHPGTSGFFDAVNFIMPRLSRFKHAAFEEEKEWRITVSRYNTASPNIYFREGIRLTPYLKLRFGVYDLAWVYIGPGGDFHDKRALRAFLATNGYDPEKVWIEHSKAPFRSD